MNKQNLETWRLQRLAVGDRFTLFKQVEQFRNKTALVFELMPDGTFSAVNFLPDMSREEVLILRKEKIATRLFQEADLALPIWKFGATDMIWELVFDVTQYQSPGQEQRLANLGKSNLVFLYAVDSTHLTVQAMRVINLPLLLFQKLMAVWQQNLKTPGFGARYDHWYHDLVRRYSVVDLWEMATDTGNMGE